MVLRRLIDTAKRAVDGIQQVRDQAHANRVKNLIASAQSIKKFENGIDCNVGSSRLVSYVRIKWVPSTVARTNDVTRLQESQRLAVRVDDMWDNPFPTKSTSLNDADPILTDRNGDRFYRGLLYQNEGGDYFLIAFIGSDMRIRTFKGNDEVRHWAEDHLEYESYKAEFG